MSFGSHSVRISNDSEPTWGSKRPQDTYVFKSEVYMRLSLSSHICFRFLHTAVPVEMCTAIRKAIAAMKLERRKLRLGRLGDLDVVISVWENVIKSYLIYSYQQIPQMLFSHSSLLFSSHQQTIHKSHNSIFAIVIAATGSSLPARKISISLGRLSQYVLLHQMSWAARSSPPSVKDPKQWQPAHASSQSQKEK